MIEIFRDYWRLSTHKELCNDFLPALICSGFTLILSLNAPSDVVKGLIMVLNNLALNASAILSGFSLAVVTMIATSSNIAIDELKKRLVPHQPRWNLFEYFVNSLVWSFLAHIIVIVYAVIQALLMDANLGLVLQNSGFYSSRGLLLAFAFAVGTFVLIYAISLTVKNIIILYGYVGKMSKR